jgi:hypothetical protein
VLDVTTTRNVGLTLLIMVLLAGLAQAHDDTVPVTFGWAPCPAMDDEGTPQALAVRYEVFVQRGTGAEQLVATVRGDTVYTMQAERGVVQRVRIVGYDSLDRPSPPSEWSDPIYFDPERSGEGGDTPRTLPDDPTLGPNYPNPFNPETRIAYSVPADVPMGTRLALEIFNLRGQRIRTFDPDPSPGWHEVTWDGKDDHGLVQSTGTYVTRYICGDTVKVAKMTMVK